MPDDVRRVAVATRIYRPEPAAAAFRLGALVDALAADGVQVEVLTTRCSPAVAATARPPQPGVHEHRWPVLRDPNGYVRGYLPYLSFDLPLVARLLVARRPDVVVVEPPPTTGVVVRLVTAVRRLPYVAYLPDVWADGTAATDSPILVKEVVRAMERFALRGAGRVVAATAEIADRAHSLHGVPRRRIVTVPNGIDCSTFTPDGPTPADAPRGPFAVYAGTTSEWQGAEILVRAWGAVLERVPNATLVFLGHGTDREELDALARALPDGGKSVLFRPLVPMAQAAAWQRAASVCLCTMRPNTAYNYFTPTKVFSAAACGTPVIYVGPGPAGDLVRENELGTAVLYSEESVSDALVAWLLAERDPAAVARRVAWARNHASIAQAGRGAAETVYCARREFQARGGLRALGPTGVTPRDLTIAYSILGDRSHLLQVPEDPQGAELLVVAQGEPGPLPAGVREVRLESRGVARSRNAAMDAATGRYLLFSDDETQVRIPGVLRAAQLLAVSGAAVAVGRCLDETGQPRKPYPARVRRLGLLGAGKVGTVEMLIDLDQVRAAGVRFDVRFGAGGQYPSGDEWIFLADLLRAGLAGFEVPEVFAAHPAQSSGTRWGPRENQTRAVVVNRVFGRWALPARIGFALLRCRRLGGLSGFARFIATATRP